MTHTVRHPRIEGYELEVHDLSAAKAAGWVVPTESAAEPEPTAEPEPEPKPRPKRTRKK